MIGVVVSITSVDSKAWGRDFCNYSRILWSEDREDRRPHEIHHSVEDVELMELGSFNDSGQGGIHVRAPF